MSTLGNNLLAQYYAQNQGLPFGYEAVEYIQNNNTTYIDTGYLAGSGCKLEIKIENPSYSQHQTAFIFGARATTNPLTNAFAFCASEPTQNVKRFDYSSQLYRINGRLIAGQHTILKNKEKNYIDGVSVGDNETAIFTGTNNIYLFTINDRGVPSDGFLVGKLFYCKIWDDDTPKRNFIPCVRKSDGKPGLYDLCKSICPLTGTPFYINAGTGEFVTP